MLSPEARAVAIDFLRPPPGFTLDQAVLTTFSLDLEALLALPLAVLAHADGGVEEVLSDPLLLLEALREAGDRIHVFVDQGGIAIPRTERSLYAMLEASVHLVRAPNGGAFHPKVWIARFRHEDETALIRVAVLSRNLTYDNSWDIALTSEAAPKGKRRQRNSRALGELLRLLPGSAVSPVTDAVVVSLEALASEAERCAFPSPDGFPDSVEFHLLGESGRDGKLWLPRANGLRLLAISPFVAPGAAESLAATVDGHKTLISRQDALDAMPEASLASWDDVLVLSEAAGAELDDESTEQPEGLHAKLVAVEHGHKASWFAGSANLTNAAYRNRNVEVMASITAGKWRNGIDTFLESGFRELCEPYRRKPPEAIAHELAEARERLEAARDALLADDALRIDCSSGENGWHWRLDGEVKLPEGVQIHAWPVSLDGQTARELPLPLEWNLPIERLTAFVAFRISVVGIKVDDVRLTLLLPATGMPENRMSVVLRSLIDSPERFLQFLRALLGGLDGLVDWSWESGATGEALNWGSGLGGESLLEDLVRIAAREPRRLDPVRRLIEDLRQTPEGRKVVDDDLIAVWNAVEAALEVRKRA